MQWSEVIAPPGARKLRQFAGLCLFVLGGLALWRWTHGQRGWGTMILGGFGGVVGVAGLLQPMAVRWVYTAWMIVAFPIGWTMSRLILGLMFFAVFTPIAAVFRMMGRDPLERKRHQTASYWAKKTGASSVDDYFRQV